MTNDEFEKAATEASAKYQTDDPQFCGVVIDKHKGFMAGAKWDREQCEQEHANIRLDIEMAWIKERDELKEALAHYAQKYGEEATRFDELKAELEKWQTDYPEHDYWKREWEAEKAKSAKYREALETIAKERKSFGLCPPIARRALEDKE